MKRALGLAVVLAVLAGAWTIWRGTPGLGPRNLPPAANLVLITIDTLRADRVGAYGHAGARTPSIDRLAREGTRFLRAFAPAPITLPSHASMLTGLYPPSHGARHNGMAIGGDVPTIATVVAAQGFETAAFIAAFPLDRRFGLGRGFDVYDDQLGRGPDGRPRDERAGSTVVDRAITWLAGRGPQRFFLWVHLFEPHAPYGDPASASGAGRSALDRYDDDVAEADRQVGRLILALSPRLDDTLILLAADHGEAFGEHGEVAHSIFVYDTTVRVPLIARGPGVLAGAAVQSPVSLVDLAPTAFRRLAVPSPAVEGVDFSAALAGDGLAPRALIYTESFAPLLDFGWAPLRSVRRGNWKYIAAPKPELYDMAADPDESQNLVDARSDEAQGLERLVRTMSGPELGSTAAVAKDAESVRRLGALGYVAGGARPPADRPDPKDRRAEAMRLAQVTSGELQGDALLAALRAIVADDPASPQANLRLGFALAERQDCAAALARFDVAIRAGMPSADPYLGRASCELASGRTDAARSTLERAIAVEPGNPVVEANLGLIESAANRHEAAAKWLAQAVVTDPDFHEARFNLALTYARQGARQKALDEARELLRRLPADAPERGEVNRLIAALTGPGR